MLNTADDPIQFLKNEAAYAGEDVIISIHAEEALFTTPTEWYIVYRARRAWRFALAAHALEDAKNARIIAALDRINYMARERGEREPHTPNRP